MAIVSYLSLYIVSALNFAAKENIISCCHCTDTVNTRMTYCTRTKRRRHFELHFPEAH